MNDTASVLPRSTLTEIEDRVYEKYEVARADARLAVDYLWCFLDAKRTRATDIIILPQIADWAWHEFVLETARYRSICTELFGQFLHHAAKPLRRGLHSETQPLREIFSASLCLMRDIYGLDLGRHPEQWLEAGWDHPEYRLRHSIDLPDWGRQSAVTAFPPIQPAATHLSWLPHRIARRFAIPLTAACRGVNEYAQVFASLNPTSSLDSRACSVLAQIAWEEHILWTERYSSDCFQIIGAFLDHVPRPPTGAGMESTTDVAA